MYVNNFGESLYMPISFGLTSNLSIAQNLSVGGSGAFASGVTLSSTTASSLLYSDAAKVVSSVTLSSNLTLTGGVLALAAAFTGVNSVTSVAGQPLVLATGTSGTAISIASATNISTFTAAISGTSLTLSSTTAAASTTTGSLQNAGGFGNAGAIYAGGDITTTLGNFRATGNTATVQLFKDATPTKAARFQFNSLADDGATIGIYDGSSWFSAIGITPTTGVVKFPSVTASTSTTSGAVQIGANIGLSGNAGGPSYFGGDVIVRKDVSGPASFSLDNRNTAGLEVLYFTEDGVATNYAYIGRINSAGTPARQVRFGAGDAVSWNFVNGNVNVSATTSASSSTTGALTIGNGTAATNVAIGGGNINAGGTITAGGANGFVSPIANGVLNLGDNSTGPNIRLVGSAAGNLAYIQVGTSSADTNANLNISRYQTGTTAINALNVYATGTTFSNIVAVSSSSASTGVGTGALQVAGGIYAGAASWLAGTVTAQQATNAENYLAVRNSYNAGGTASFASIYASTDSGGSEDLYLKKYSLNHATLPSQAWLGTAGAATTLVLAVNNTAALTFNTGRNATFSNSVITSSSTLSGAGAIPITTSLVKFTSTGAAQALTLANGVDGQRLTIVHDVDGGSGVLTPTTKTGFSTVTFTNAGDTVDLVYVTTRGWMVVGSYLATIAP